MNQSKISTLQDLTVGEIVADNYHTAGVFRQYGLDFCCGGGITLKKACKNHGLDLEQVKKELLETYQTDVSGNQQFNAWEPDYLIDYIINTHHRFVRNKTEELFPFLQKIARVHGQTSPHHVEIFQTFCDLSSEMMHHLEDEEKIVFPLIKSIYQKRKRGETVSSEEIEELKKQLNNMLDDHDGAGEKMQKIRRLSNGYATSEDSCTTYRMVYQNLEGFEADLHKHVHLENNILFRKAEDLITS